MTAKAKSRTRLPRQTAKADATITQAPVATADDIRRAMIAKLPKPGVPMSTEQADRILAANGIPRAKLLSRLLPGARWLGGLTAQAGIAVATPLLTAAVDGLGLLIAAMTVYELWHPVEAMADALLGQYGR